MKGLKIGVLLLVVLGAVGVCSVVGKGCGLVGSMVDDGINTAKKEFSPSALLKKYEWFKDQHAALAAKKAQITNYQNEVKDFVEMYGDENGKIDMRTVPRDERQSYAQTKTTIRGLISKFNSMAAEYNAQMVKFNYRFCNAGDLPQGATEPLPREHVQYATE